MGRKRLHPADRPLVSEGDDSGLVVSFAVGPSGVGPVMGFGSDDFFPVVAAADAGNGHRSVDTPEVGEAGGSPAAGVLTSSADEPIRGVNAPSGS